MQSSLPAEQDPASFIKSGNRVLTTTKRSPAKIDWTNLLNSAIVYSVDDSVLVLASKAYGYDGLQRNTPTAETCCFPAFEFFFVLLFVMVMDGFGCL